MADSAMTPEWRATLQTGKWNEKKDRIVELQGWLSAGQLPATAYGDVIAILTEVVDKENNIACVTEAVKCLSIVVPLVGAEVTAYGKQIVKSLLPRFKEKKPALVEQLKSVLDAVFAQGGVSFADVGDDMQGLFGAKNPPQVKAEVLSWLTRCLPKCNKASLGAGASVIGTTIAGALEDSQGAVRDAACTAMGALAQAIGRGAALNYVSKLQSSNDTVYKKVLEACGASAGDSAAPAAPAAAAPSAPPAPQRSQSAYTLPVSRGSSEPAAPAAAAPKPAPAAAAPRPKAKEEADDEGAADAEARAAALFPESVLKNLGSTAWKERLEAVTDLGAFVGRMDDGEKAANADLIVRFVLKKQPGFADNNFQVCAKVLEVALALVRAVCPVPRKMAADLAAAATLKLGEAKVKPVALDLLTALVEGAGPQAVFAEMYKAVGGQSNPKVSEAALAWMQGTVVAFGALNLKPADAAAFLKPLFEESNPKVRAGASELAAELYRRMGMGLRKQFEDAKPTVLAALDKIDRDAPIPEPTRTVRPGVELDDGSAAGPKKRAVAAAGGGAGAGARTAAGASGSAGPGPTAAATAASAAPAGDEDLEEKAVSLFGSETLKNMSAEKWKERLEAAAAVVEVLGRMNRSEKESCAEATLCFALKPAHSDVNLAVQSKVFEAAAQIYRVADNVPKRVAATLVPVAVSKLPEGKKTPAADALTAMVSACGQQYIAGLVMKAAAAHGSPKVTQEALAWLCSMLQTYGLGNLRVGDVVAFTKKCLDDANQKIRASAIDLLCELKLRGVDVLSALGEVKPAVRTTLEAALAKAGDAAPEPTGTVRNAIREDEPATAAAPKKKPAAAPSAAAAGPATTASAAPPMLKRPGSAPVLGAAATAAAARPKPAGTAAPVPRAPTPSGVGPGASAARKPPAAAAAAAGGPSRAARDDDAEEEGPSMTPEEADERAAALFPESVLKNLGSTAWKERLEAVTAIAQAVEQMSGPERDNICEALVRFVLKKAPTYTDNNMQVCSKTFEVVTLLARGTSSFARRTAAAVIPSAVQKLADPKVGRAAGETLIALAEAISLQFVLAQLYKACAAASNPKVLIEALSWIVTAMTDFGLAGVRVSDLIAFIKSALEESNPKARTGAIDVIVELRRRVGPSLLDLFGDIKPAQLSTIESALKNPKAEEPAPEPTRTMRAAPAAGSRTAAPMSAKDIEREMLEAMPRTDISGQITSALLAQLSNADWKERQAAIKTVSDILAAAPRIAPNVGGLMSALKARLAESNKNLVQTVLEILGRLATAMGKPIERSIKALAGPMMEAWADNKKNVRDAATTALDCMVTETSIEPFVHYLAVPLQSDVPTSRREALLFALRHLSAADTSTMDLSELVKPTLACLEDRTTEIRDLGKKLMEIVVRSVGFAAVKRACKDLKPASMLMVTEMLKPFEGIAPAGAAAGAAPAAGPAAAGGATAAAAGGAVAAPATAATAAPAESTMTPKRRSVSTIAAAPTGAAGALQGTLKRPPSASAVPAGAAAASTAAGRARTGSLPAGAAAAAPVVVAAVAAAAPAGPALAAAMGPSRRKDDAGAGVCALLPNEQKEARAKRDKRQHWSVLVDGEPRVGEQAELLSSELAACATEALAAKMMALDFKKRVDAVADILTSMTVAPQAALDSLDVLLKWMTLCFIEGSPALHGRILDLAKALFALLQERSLSLSEYEAGIIAPSLVAHLGNNNEKTRTGARQLLTSLCLLYPASRVLTFLLDGLKAKNARVRSESLELMQELLTRYGVDAPVVGRMLPSIAMQAGERDAGAVRAAALGVMGVVFEALGATMWKYLTKVPDTLRETLEARFKTPTVVASADRVRMSTLQLPSVDEEAALASTETPTLPQRSTGASGAFGAATAPPSSTQVPSTPTGAGGLSGDVMFTLADIDSWTSALQAAGVPEEVFVDMLRKLFSALNKAEALFVQRADTLAHVMCIQMRYVFSMEPRNVRMCKYVVNMLLGMMSSTAVAARISRERMYPLQEALITALLDPSIVELAEGPALSKAMNVVMIKVLANGEPTAVLVPLLMLLADAVSHDSGSDSKKRIELILKCLMKLRLTLDKMAPQLDLPAVLLALHKSVLAHNDSVSVSADLVSLRTLRQLVHDLARVRPRDLTHALSAARLPVDSPLLPLLAAAGVQVPMMPVAAPDAAGVGSLPAVSPAPMLPALSATPSTAPTTQELAARLAGLMQQKERLAPATAGTASAPIGTVVAAPTAATAAAATPAAPLSGASPTDTLRDIFRRLSERGQGAAALRDLHAFTTAHPDVDLEPYLARSSTQFREYVQRGLQRAAAGTLLDEDAPAVSASLAGEAASRLQALTSRLGPAADKENTLPRTGPVENTPVPAPLSLDELRLRAKALATAQLAAATSKPLVGSGPSGGAVASAVPAVPTSVTAPSVNQAVHDLRARLTRLRTEDV